MFEGAFKREALEEHSPWRRRAVFQEVTEEALSDLLRGEEVLGGEGDALIEGGRVPSRFRRLGPTLQVLLQVGDPEGQGVLSRGLEVLFKGEDDLKEDRVRRWFVREQPKAFSVECGFGVRGA